MTIIDDSLPHLHEECQERTETLARMVWSGTQRCYRIHEPYCYECAAAIAYLTELGLGDRIKEWAAEA